MDGECLRLRRISRMLERRYRKSKSMPDRLAWVQHERKRHSVYRDKEQAHWQNIINSHVGQPKRLWSTLSSLLHRSEASHGVDVPTADNLLDHFTDKVNQIRAGTQGLSSPLATPSADSADSVPPRNLDNFELCTPGLIHGIIMSSSTTSCSQDPIPFPPQGVSA